MSDEEILTTTVLPCGCVTRRVIREGVREFQIVACRQDCPNVVKAVELAAEMGKPTETRLATDAILNRLES